MKLTLYHDHHLEDLPLKKMQNPVLAKGSLLSLSLNDTLSNPLLS